MQAKAPVLVFGYGNPSRGDDALAPLLIDRLQQNLSDTNPASPIRFLSDYQMQIEHVTDMQGCARVLLIDAHADLDQPYRFFPVQAMNETRYTTHGMSPGTLVHTYQQTFQSPPPPTAMLAIAGYRFDLGQGLSPQAETNLAQAFSFCKALLAEDFGAWERQFDSQTPPAIEQD